MASRVPPRPLGLIVPRQKRERITDDDHKRFIRSLPCCVCGDITSVECAHVSFVDLRYGKDGRAYGRKAQDIWTLPLCTQHHRLQHGMNEIKFWQDVKLDPVRICAALYIHTGDTEMAQIIIQANREASK